MRYEPSNVSSKYGAPMGRYTTRRTDLPTEPVRLSLQRVRLNQGGYDSGGAYWGIGQPLYVATDFEDVQLFVRGHSRDDAKRNVLAILPLATFFR